MAVAVISSVSGAFVGGGGKLFVLERHQLHEERQRDRRVGLAADGCVKAL
jgi:hypothetical protein